MQWVSETRAVDFRLASISGRSAPLPVGLSSGFSRAAVESVNSKKQSEAIGAVESGPGSLAASPPTLSAAPPPHSHPVLQGPKQETIATRRINQSRGGWREGRERVALDFWNLSWTHSTGGADAALPHG